VGIIKLEKLSGHAKKGKIIRVLAETGQEVKTGNIILEVESKKGNVAVEADFDFKVEKVLIQEGQDISIGDQIFEILGDNDQDKEKEEKKDAGSGFSYMGNMMKPKKEEIETEIAILGGGPGGYVAALQAGLLGIKTVLIEKKALGGTCLNEGCIPTKTLVRSAEVFELIKESHKFGIKVSDAEINLKDVIKRKDSVIGELVSGIEYLLEKRGVRIVRGKGELVDQNVIKIMQGRNETTVKAKNIIIATGGKPCGLIIPGIQSENVITSTEALMLNEVPEKMLIVGGGIIGMEFAFIYASFGSKVTVVEYADKILNILDDDVIEVILESAKEKGIEIVTGSAVEEIIKDENGKSIVKATKGDEKKYFSADKILLSVGRNTCFDGVPYEKLGIELNETHNGIKVDEHMRTNIENIYAIGDVTRKMLLAHVASHQGVVAIKNIAGETEEMDYSVVPNVVFTMPEVASVGLSESEAGDNVKISKFPFQANGKALALGETKGFVKLIEDKDKNQIVGAVIVGPHASDMIGEVAVCIKNKLGADAIIHTIHAHPTTVEAIHEAALGLQGGALHFA
jgi:dihydrolipoamide dehydrogenase